MNPSRYRDEILADWRTRAPFRYAKESAMTAWAGWAAETASEIAAEEVRVARAELQACIDKAMEHWEDGSLSMGGRLVCIRAALRGDTVAKHVIDAEGDEDDHSCTCHLGNSAPCRHCRDCTDCHPDAQAAQEARDAQ